MTRVILHIGQHKTGTSSLQQSFFVAQRQGRLENTIYCRSPIANQSKFITSLYGSRESQEYYDRVKNGYRVILRHRNSKRYKRILDASLQEAIDRKKDFLMIAEDFCVLAPKELMRIQEYFVSKGITDLKILGYIRPVEAFAHSFAQEKIKDGCTIENVIEQPPTPNYRDIFEKFFTIFGDSNTCISPFNSDIFSNNPYWKILLIMQDYGKILRKFESFT